MKQFPLNKRNKVKRVPQRGHYDRASVYQILDAGFLCHVSFVIDGQPFVIPTAYGRKDDILYFHGATKSRMMQHLESGAPACVAVTHLDGIVLARSAFHHSMNYRSVVVFGTAQKVEGIEKEKALEIISEYILPGRWAECRQPNAIELKATTVLALQIEQASAKIRTGPPKDDAADYSLSIWAGIVPMQLTYLPPEPDPQLDVSIKPAESVTPFIKT